MSGLWAIYRWLWAPYGRVMGFTVLGYHWLPLATIDLVGDNREFEILVIF